MVVGGVTAGAAKIGENLSDDPDDKKVFKFIGDCGGGIATGGAISGVAEVGGGLLGLGGKVGSNVGSAAARKAAAGKSLTVDGAKLLYTSAERARIIASATHGIKVMGQAETAFSLLKDLG